MNLGWLWVTLWAIGVVAFLVFFFRGWGGWRAFLWWMVGIVVFIASLILQFALEEVPAYARFVAALEPIGRDVVIVAVIVEIAALAVGIVCTVRHGKPEHAKADIGSSTRGAFFQGPGSPLMTRRSRIGTLYRAGEYVEMKRLVDGTATSDERLIFIAVFVALTAFTLIFVGVSLMLVGKLLIAVILPVGAAHVLYLNVRIALRQYREARQPINSSTSGSRRSG